MKIFIYGAPASGKSTLGEKLSARLRTAFTDLDREIEKKAGMTVPEVFSTCGESVFRDMESKALAEVADAPGDRVISLGGGALLRESNRALCEEKGVVFCIDTPPEAEIRRRIQASEGSRPLGDKAAERAGHYASFPCRVADSFDAGPSLVVVGSGIAGAVLRGRNVVCDETVSKIWSGRLGISPFAEIPSGEVHKTPGTVASLWHAFAGKGLGRKDAVVALGGGVTGDLTGFAAATWMRGMAWINVPTTLLSMVDASTGGKTGCDLPEGKNLAGAFHFPDLVVIDTDFLSTLPPGILADGKAEMIKHALVGGRDVPVPAAGECPGAREIAENLRVKVGIVRKDPLETGGQRMLLNCGHTIGHAVEKLSGYAVSHGEAVAIGCCEEARMAVRRSLAPAGWPEELERVFSSAGLPVSVPPKMSRALIAEAVKGDKKRSGDVVSFALPCGWGDVRIVPVDMTKEDVL